MAEWHPMESAPKNKRVLLLFYGKIISSGEYRYGMRGEPSQDKIEWRCDCCGRFGNPDGWMDISELNGGS